MVILKTQEDRTNNYLGRKIDKRMVEIIRKFFNSESSILDLACGSGLYGPYLRPKCNKLIGLDYDEVLCHKVAGERIYDQVIAADAKELDTKIDLAGCTFCSEFLEHLDNKDLRKMLDSMENITKDKVIITVPNPLSPHFRYDTSHILKYSVRSLLKTLNQSKKFRYKVYPLGFSQKNLGKIQYRFLNPLAKIFPIFSPTVLYVGKPK